LRDRIASFGRGSRAARAKRRVPPSRRRRRPAVRAGFSLLEVILALAILAGAVAVLGEIARNGIESTRIARGLTHAQLLCESKMAEIVAGIEWPQSVDRAKIENLDDPTQLNWVYSIESETTEIEGLLSVRVTVMQDLPDENRPVRCTLVRWMADPNVETEDMTSEESSP
jgi:prepilin-type N-terminal cleavage/methylation domain-containing protein